jgi:5-methyltetrahydropteroyltriglutamate--homocysteine methyltransferase
LVEGSEGLVSGPLTRFLDTNTFYRAPLATGAEPRLSRLLDAQFVVPLAGPRLVTLPSPYAFSRGTGLSPRALAEGVLRPQLDALDVELVVLVEPFLAREPRPDLDGLAEALEILAGGPRLALQLTFGDAGPLLAGLQELPVDGIGIDFYATGLEAVPEGFGKLLLAGVVDVRSSLLEDPDEMAHFAAGLRERVVGEVALVPNGDLQYVSEPIARAKLERLGAAKTAAAKEAA